jgi:hypothetical protein
MKFYKIIKFGTQELKTYFQKFVASFCLRASNQFNWPGAAFTTLYYLPKL